MVLAMHHIQVACIARHGARRRRSSRTTSARLVEQQLLIASITSEVGVVGRHALRDLRGRAPTAPAFASTRTRPRSRTARTPTICSSPAAATPTPRRATRSWCWCARATTTLTQTDDVGHARHARHVQPRLQAGLGSGRDRADRSPARSPTRRRRRWSRTRTSCGASRVARHRVGRGRARQRLRPRRGAQEAGHGAAGGAPSGRGRGRRSRRCATTSPASAAEFDGIMQRPTGMDELLTIGWALQDEQHQGRRVRDGAADRPRRAADRRHRRLQERRQVLRRAPLPRRALGVADDLATIASSRRPRRCCSSSRTIDACRPPTTTRRRSTTDLVEHGLIVPVGVPGVVRPRSASSRTSLERFNALVTAAREGRRRRGLHVPAGDRSQDPRERVDYLDSFPHLAGTRLQLLRQRSRGARSSPTRSTRASRGATLHGDDRRRAQPGRLLSGLPDPRRHASREGPPRHDDRTGSSATSRRPSRRACRRFACASSSAPAARRRRRVARHVAAARSRPARVARPARASRTSRPIRSSAARARCSGTARRRRS